MSTSSELNIPSTSSAETDFVERANPLDADLLANVFRHVVASCPIKDSLRLQGVHPLAARCLSSSLSRHSHLRIVIHEPLRFCIQGMQKVELPQPQPHILIQGSRVDSVAEAASLLGFLLSSCRLISRLSLVLEDTDTEIADQLIELVIKAENVHLSVLHVQRREGGRPIDAVSRLITANADTLRIIGRVGICEAAAAFSSKIHLDRLSLMTFDLQVEATTTNILEKLVTIQKSGATFCHLSYSSFSGFDPTDERLQQFLDESGVCSLRLTMMRGPNVPPKADYMIGKVRKITHLELGEVVDKPNIVNRLVTHEKLYKKVFPNVGHITFFQRW